MIEANTSEKKALKILFSDYTTEYNAHTIKEKLGVSHRYSTTVLANLEEKNIVAGKQMGKAIFYQPKLKNPYVIKLLELIYTDHSDESNYTKGWIQDLQVFKSFAASVLLFGSILTKGKEAQDVDVCFILKKYNDYKVIEQKIKEVNSTHKLKIHALYLTKKDFIQKLKDGDKPLIDIVRTCIVVHNPDLFVRIVINGRRKVIAG